MKATITILAAVFTLQAGILFAGNETISAPVANEIAMISLAPITPVGAAVEDINTTTVDIATLAPSMPPEADFSDFSTDANIDLTSLTPITPAIADFNDSSDVAIDISALAPVTPVTADLE